MLLYDDGDRPNAKAIPTPMDPQAGPDGTVLLGINLVESEWRKAPIRNFKDASLEIILAHEFAHILQYKNGMTPDGPWQMEPHADFMAGWALSQHMQSYWKGGDAEDIEIAVRSVFEKGDIDFYDDHHGEPELRAAMVRAGVEAFKLNVKAAFEKGRKMASLK